MGAAEGADLLHAEGKVEGDLALLAGARSSVGGGLAGGRRLLLLHVHGLLLLLLGVDEGKEGVAGESLDGLRQVLLLREELVRHQTHRLPSHALICSPPT
jgi:hypothetical protein